MREVSDLPRSGNSKLKVDTYATSPWVCIFFKKAFRYPELLRDDLVPELAQQKKKISFSSTYRVGNCF